MGGRQVLFHFKDPRVEIVIDRTLSTTTRPVTL
jgi:hypothetical protein